MNPLSHIRQFLLQVVCCFSLAAMTQQFCAESESSAASFQSEKLKGIDISYDSFEYIGQNVIARGHVVVKWMNYQLTADRAVINLDNNDLEVAGSVTFVSTRTTRKLVTVREYEEMLQNPYSLANLVQYQLTPTGEQKVVVDVLENETVIKADRAALNLENGSMQFQNFSARFGVTYASGESAERTFDGRFMFKNTKITTCEYLADDHDHYAIFSKDACLTPRDSNRGLLNYSMSMGDHSIWTLNSFLEVWGVPVFWLPALYKPRAFSSFGGVFEFGSTSSWGNYFRISKDFTILDEPYINTNLMVDYYSKRGPAFGTSVDIITPESTSEIFFFNIFDRNPQQYFDRDYDKTIHEKWYEANSRLALRNYRYDIKFANMTHLTPNLDFRGQVELLSDFNVLRDFFPERYNESVEPPTYVALEHQTERTVESLYANVKVNRFFTTVEHLPELKFEMPRQELFGNLYFQGEQSFDYLRMNWRKFDYDSTSKNNVELKRYDAARFDFLQMFYYPLRFWNINLIPRTGMRLTGYSKSSDNAVERADLNAMFIDNAIIGQPDQNIENSYDRKGGGKVRVIGELGAEMNTKFYRTWQDVRSSYWELDGLRHVLVPYVNYTFIPKPTVNRDYLFYFDDIDRISEQNFVRLGMVNRLQTRRNGKIQEIMSLETFWDYCIHAEDGFRNCGDLGVVWKFMPFQGLTVRTEALFDTSSSDGSHDKQASRGGRPSGRPGISNSWIDKLSGSIIYEFAPNWRASAGYAYTDAYVSRSVYSMGSTLTQISSTSAFENSNAARTQTVSAALDFPLYFDKTLFGGIAMSYDIEAGMMNDISFYLSKDFHCWHLMVATGRRTTRDSDKGRKNKYYVTTFLSLTAMPTVKYRYNFQTK